MKLEKDLRKFLFNVSVAVIAAVASAYIVKQFDL